MHLYCESQSPRRACPTSLDDRRKYSVLYFSRKAGNLSLNSRQYTLNLKLPVPLLVLYVQYSAGLVCNREAGGAICLGNTSAPSNLHTPLARPRAKQQQFCSEPYDLSQVERQKHRSTRPLLKANPARDATPLKLPCCSRLRRGARSQACPAFGFCLRHQPSPVPASQSIHVRGQWRK